MQNIIKSELFESIRLFDILAPSGEKKTVCIGGAPDYEYCQNPRFYIMKATDDGDVRIWDGYSIYYNDAPKLGPRQFYIKIDESPPPGTAERYLRDEENLKAMVEQKIVKVIKNMHKEDGRRFIAVELLLTDREIIHRCEGCEEWEDVVSTTLKFKRCSGCSHYQYYFYCGDECQKKNWSGRSGELAHKTIRKKDEATAKKRTQFERGMFLRNMGFKTVDELAKEMNLH